jgi:hypothetical protein
MSDYLAVLSFSLSWIFEGYSLIHAFLSVGAFDVTFYGEYCVIQIVSFILTILNNYFTMMEAQFSKLSVRDLFFHSLMLIFAVDFSVDC